MLTRLILLSLVASAAVALPAEQAQAGVIITDGKGAPTRDGDSSVSDTNTLSSSTQRGRATLTNDERQLYVFFAMVATGHDAALESGVAGDYDEDALQATLDDGGELPAALGCEAASSSLLAALVSAALLLARRRRA